MVSFLFICPERTAHADSQIKERNVNIKEECNIVQNDCLPIVWCGFNEKKNNALINVSYVFEMKLKRML